MDKISIKKPSFDLPFEVIDAHVHPFITDNENFGDMWFCEALTLSEFERTLRAAGVSRCAGSVLGYSFDSPGAAEQYGKKHLAALREIDGDPVHMMKKFNRHLLEVKRILDDFYIPGLQILPEEEDASCAEIEYYHKFHNVCMIGELCPYAVGYEHYLTNTTSPVWELASSLGMIVSLHPSDNEDLARLLENFPKLKVVVAHPGATKKFYCDRLEMLKKYPNLYLDLSGSGLFRHNLLSYGIRRVGAEKFVFGSDYPICNPGMMISGVLFEDGIRDEDLEKVFSGNFKRLYDEK